MTPEADPTFDADAFMQQQIDEPMATEFEMVDPGTYKAVIADFTSEAFQKIDFEYKKGDRAGQPGSMLKFDLPFVILDDKQRAKLNKGDGQQLVVVRNMIVDQTTDGQLDFGVNKNVALGNVRAAVGQNTKGAWGVANLRGAGPLMVKVAHETFKRSDGSPGKKAVVVHCAPLRT
jgi:hypothetical protein